NLTGSMALLAASLKDGRDVLMKRDLLGNAGGKGGRAHEKNERQPLPNGRGSVLCHLLGSSLRPRTQRGGIGRGVERNVEPADHHLFPSLIAPTHFFGRIRIVLVIWRIVMMRGALDPS